MSSRLQRILVKLAQEHAPHLVRDGWDQGGDPLDRLQRLARQLAHHNVLVLLGDLRPELRAAREIHIQDWVRSCAQFYFLLARELFGPESTLSAYLADEHDPPVAVLEGKNSAYPVLEVMAGFVLPYLTARQPKVYDLELLGLMDLVLSELAADEGKYRRLHRQGVHLIERMLNSTVQHVSLTTFDRPILNVIRGDEPPPQSARPTQPPPTEQPSPPQPPAESNPLQQTIDDMQDDSDVRTPTERLFTVHIPLPRLPHERGGDTGRLPLPGLPDDDDDNDNDNRNGSRR